MSDAGRGWAGLSEQHLLPDAVVAYVDGELCAAAVDRAAAHVARCPYCAAEVGAQRQARAAVQSADTPATPAALLASLRAIPEQVELPTSPDGLAVTEDGQLVTVLRPDRIAALGSTPPLGSSTRLGEGRAVLGVRIGRRAAQGAGVVVSGLVLGALALTGGAGPMDEREEPSAEERPAVNIQPAELVGTPAGHHLSHISLR
jgi:anti-sigma factor RsiW